MAPSLSVSTRAIGTFVGAEVRPGIFALATHSVIAELTSIALPIAPVEGSKALALALVELAIVSADVGPGFPTVSMSHIVNPISNVYVTAFPASPGVDKSIPFVGTLTIALLHQINVTAVISSARVIDVLGRSCSLVLH